MASNTTKSPPKPSGLQRYRLLACIDALPDHKPGEIITVSRIKAKALGITTKTAEKV